MKRFYKHATVEMTDGGWRVLLDGRPIKTAGGRPQVVPSRALADELASEWSAQGDIIDARSFPMRDLADFAIDAVASDRAQSIADMLPYAETDTLCYRADPDEALYARQLEQWEPLLLAAEAGYGIRFTRVSGIVHKAQPADTLAGISATLAAQSDFSIAALKMLSSLSASLVIALTAITPDADIDTLWNAANLEEDWQAELWGEDAEATLRRAERYEAFALASRFAALART